MNSSANPAVDNHGQSADSGYSQCLKDHVQGKFGQIARLAEGNTWQRFRYLRDVARADPGLARLLEGHLDATAILHEAGRDTDEQASYAIWASGGPASTTVINRKHRSLVIVGTKAFCSGSDLVDRALVLTDDDGSLVEVDMANAKDTITWQRDWTALAFSSTHTWATTFHEVPLVENVRIREPEWYFKRPGFWQGALCPAACWAGGAMGLIDYARSKCTKGPHALAHLGAMVAAERSMNSSLMCAAGEVDADPTDTSSEAYPRALAVRHHIERMCHEVMDHFGRLFGPRPLAFDSRIEKQYAELTLYIRQCHGERDLEELGTKALGTKAQ